MNRKLINSFILSLIVFSSYSQLLYPEKTDFIEIEPEIEKLKKEGQLGTKKGQALAAQYLALNRKLGWRTGSSDL